MASLLLIQALVLAAGCGLAYMFLRQNGRILIRLEAIEHEIMSRRFRQSLAQDTSHPLSDEADDNQLANSDPLRNSRINRNGLRAGTQAPVFSLPSLDRPEPISLDEFRGGDFLLLFLAAADCGLCDVLIRRLSLVSRHPVADRIVVIVTGPAEDYKRKAESLGLRFPAARQQHWEVSRQYGTFRLPSAYRIDHSGLLATDLIVGAQIQSSSWRVIFSVNCLAKMSQRKYSGQSR
jgi:peroxiredoxin